jgi:hypothetical protein
MLLHMKLLKLKSEELKLLNYVFLDQNKLETRHYSLIC